MDDLFSGISNIQVKRSIDMSSMKWCFLYIYAVFTNANNISYQYLLKWIE